MRTLYRTLFDITSDGSSMDNFLFALNEVHEWVKNKYSNMGVNAEIPTQGEIIYPVEKHSISARYREIGRDDPAIFTMHWQHPDDNDEDMNWVVDLAVAKYRKRVQFSLALEIASSRTSIRPLRFTVGMPRLVRNIIKNKTCLIDGWPIPTGVEILQPSDVQPFLEKILLNESRNIPVVMLSPSTRDDIFQGNADSVLEQLLGLAHVSVLNNKEATYKLTELSRKELSCFNGAVRIYWPNFSLHDDLKKHKLFFEDEYHDHTSLSKRIFQILSRLSTYRVGKGEVLSLADDFFVSIDRSEVSRLRTQIEELRENRRAECPECNIYLDELEKSLQEQERLFEENKQLKIDLATSQENLNACWAMYPDRNRNEEENEENEHAYATVYEATLAASQDFTDTLVFLESSFESARHSPFSRPRDVYRALHALHQITQKWKKNNGTLGISWRDALKPLGFEFKPHISDTSKTRWEEDYTFIYNKKSLVFENHIRLGSGDPNSCLSIHLYRDDKNLVNVVGHCGKHLRNTST